MTQAGAAYQTQAIQDRNELVMQELSTVYYIAVRIHERVPQHVELEDLVNAGVVGLLEASRNFQASKNAQFKTFAKFRIRGAILDSLRDLDWGTRTLRRRGREISDITSKLQGKLGRNPTDEEIAEAMDLGVERLRTTMAKLDSLYIAGQEIATSDDHSESLDVIESAPNLDAPDPFELCFQGEVNEYLAEAISNLTEREQLILSLYYREELTMKEIAAIVGVALSRVSQIRQAAIEKLRQAMDHVRERPSVARAIAPAGETYAIS